MRSQFKLICLAISLLLLVSLAQAVTVNITSTQSWTVPTGVISVNVSMYGGGGGGSGGRGEAWAQAYCPSVYYKGYGGNAATLTAYPNIAVTPGSPVSVVIGTGGTAGAANGGTGGTGTNSSFGSRNATGGTGGTGYVSGGTTGAAGNTSVAGYPTASTGGYGYSRIYNSGCQECTAESQTVPTAGGSGYGAGGGGGGYGAVESSHGCQGWGGVGGAGAAGIVSITYTVLPCSTVAFTQNESSGAVPLNILFTDRSTNTPTGWNWSFGDGTLSTSQNPTHVYSTPGMYNVTLNVTNAVGTNITTFYRCVIAGQAPQTNPSYQKLYMPFNGTDGSHVILDKSISNNTIISVGNATISTTRYKFGGSSLSLDGISATHLLIPYNNSLAYGTNNFYIGWWQNDTSIGSSQVLYTDRRVNFTHVIDGFLYSYSIPATYNYWAAYIANKSAWDTISNQNMGTLSCKTWSYYAIVRNDSSFQTWRDGALIANSVIVGTINNTHRAQWIGAYQPSYSSMSTGAFNSYIDDFVVYNGQALNGSIVPTRELLTNPTSVFLASNISGQFPVYVNFTDISLGDAIRTWNWSFGDGTFSNSQNPNHQYNNVGNYTVILNISNQFGWDNSSQFINVSSKIITEFTANTTLGGNPLAVGFTDQSTNSTGWAWFFGDENYTNPFIIDNPSSGWSQRRASQLVSMPNGDLILIAGISTSTVNDTWKSTDKGVTWTLINASCGFQPRNYFSAISTHDGDIILTGGISSVYLNDTWISHDGGKIWTLVNASSGWDIRAQHQITELPDGSIILTGGLNSVSAGFNDTWKSTDKGVTWTLVNASGGWNTRRYHSLVSTNSGMLILTGGLSTVYLNDTWVSIDNGSHWTLANSSSGWQPRFTHLTLFMPDNSILLMGGTDLVLGNYYTDIWRSTDNGSTWVQVNASTNMFGIGHLCTAAIIPNGSIIIAGGRNVSVNYNNYTYIFNPVGSSSQNPSHVYQSSGFFNVSLQTYNTFSFNKTSKISYITVETQSVSGFNANVTSGSRNLAVGFNVTNATDFASMWNWSFGDGTWQNGTTQNATHLYTTAGIYSVTEIASSTNLTNSTTLTNYITVGNKTFSNFTSNITFGILPDVGVEYDSSNSTNATGWAWFFGDENYTQPWVLQNANSGWGARYFHRSVVLPDGSIIITGGQNATSGVSYNDTWRSTDQGVTWVLQNASSGWFPRLTHDLVALLDGSIVLTGGQDSIIGIRNDTWRSTDQGVTWVLQNASSGWTVRASHSTYAALDGSIILVGGSDGANNNNETWRSTDKGATWSLINASSGWTARKNMAKATTPDNGIFVIGGIDSTYRNDTWKSIDNGVTWTLMNASSGWQPYRGGSVASMPDGSLLTLGGAGTLFYNDTWRSTDSGIHWTLTNISPGYTGRWGYGAAVLNNGSIVLTGGYDPSLLNDTWIFNPVGSTEQNPIHTYTLYGRYNVSLRTYDSVSYNDTFAPWYFRVFNFTVSGFSANVTTGTFPLNVGFNVTYPNDNATTWNWSFGDGIWHNGTDQNVTHIYNDSGVFTVTEIAALLPNVSIGTTRIDYITVGNTTVSGFTANVTSGVEPLAVGFNVTTGVDNATQWNWSFGDGTWQNGTTQNATHVYSNGGIYTITEIASNQFGGYNLTTILDYITVYNKTISGFTANVTNGSISHGNPNETSSIMFNVTNPNDNATMWNWSFGDGNWSNGTNQNVTYTYVFPGNFTVTEIASNAGDSNTTTIIDFIHIYDHILAEFTANVTSGYYPLHVGFNVTNPADSATMWNWSFGDGFWQNGTEQNATHIYLTSGIYTVTEYATNPGDFHNYTLFDYITVYNTTISGFTANVTSGVEPLAVGFNVTTGVDNATQWNWSFGDGTWQNGTDQNATHVYSNGGIYTVIEIASNAAFSNMTTLIDYVTVYNKTISGFTATFLTSNIEPSLVGFNVTNADDNATQWNWSFGDGTWQNGTDQNVTHIYSNGGIYTVSEIASNDGDSNTTTLIDYITIYNRTISGFESNVTVGTEPLAVGFNVTTVTDNATRWNWSFGDGTLYNGTDQTLYQNVSHVYSNGGIYTVTETAQDGPSYNITQLVDYITVYNQTHNTFTSNETSGFIPLSITFLLTNDTNVTFWNWSFGDGTWSNYTNGSATVIHTYTTVNNFTVNLTTSEDGLGGFCTTTNYINATYYAPVTVFTATPMFGTAPLYVSFIDGTLNGPEFWNWSFGDGSSFDYNQFTNHIYLLSGTYTVTLETNNSFGYSNFSLNITVSPGNPIANFTADTTIGPNPLTVQFTDDSTYTAPVTWAWNFGDGNTSNIANPSHTYTSNGVYRVNLTIQDAVNIDKSNDTLIYVTSSLTPIPDFIANVTSGFSPLPVQFTDLTLGGATAWNWSFGDGNYSNSQNPIHTYVSDGQYSVTLIVVNGTYTNYTSKIGYINVNVSSNVVYANFTATPLSGNYPLTVQFIDASVCNPICTNWNWDLDGDGSTDSNAQNPLFTYNYPLSYSPKLITSNGLNSGTKIRLNYIVVGPTYIPTTIPQPTGTWIPGYRDNNLSVSFRGDATTDLNNGTYLKYWLQNFTATGNFNIYGFVTSLMAPLMHVFGFWIYLIIWGVYIFAVWIRAQDVTLPLIIGILSMGTFGLLFPKEALPVIIIMFVICGAIIVTKLMKDSI